MKTPAEKATELYSIGCDRVMSGGAALRGLASHLVVMVNGNSEYAGGLWRERAWPDRTITLDRFEDYLLKPVRDGLGIPSLLWLSRVLDAHEDKDEREKAIAALRQEIPDFDDRVDEERLKMRNRQTVPETTHGGSRKGAGRKAKEDEVNQDANSNLNKRTKGSTKSETIIARLKRDAASDPHAEALLGSIEAGDIKPYRAAVEMGWVKPPDPLVAIEKHLDRLENEDRIHLWQELGRSLPADAINPLEAAKEALLNLNQDEAKAIMAWWQEVAK